MSLIHWWPLNGDPYDYGTNPRHGSVIGAASLEATGKLGYALSAGNGSQITAGVSVSNCNLLDEISDEYSAALWFKVHGTHVHYEGAFISSGDWNNKCWTFGINQANNRIQPLTNASNQNYVNLKTTLEIDKWYHVVTVYKNGIAYLFLNGTLEGQVSAQAPYQSSATNLTIGRETYASGYFSFNGDICDVRIYDHAISVAEIKELSKALAIHLPFNDVCTEHTDNLVTSLTAGGRTTYNSVDMSITTTGDNSDTYFYINTSSALTQGATYTLQCMAENIEADKYFTFGVGAQASGNPQFKIQNGYNELTFVGTANTATTRILLDDSARTGWERKAKFYNFQIEKRDHATPYTKKSRVLPAPYNEAGGTKAVYSTPIYLTTDSANGSLSWINDGSRYINFPSRGDASHGATVSVWLKTEGDISTQSWVAFADANSQLGFGPYTSSGANAYGVIASTSSTNKRRASNLSALWKNNQWNHVVVSMSSDNTVNRCFINGTEVAYGTADTWTHGTYTTIGARYSSSSFSRFFPGLMSDFRLYHTCLSDEDILDLYKTKGYISNLGDVNSNQMIENKTQAQVTNKFIFEAKEFCEMMGDFERLEYIESTGTQYINTTYVPTSTNFSYELDMAWTGSAVGSFYSFMGYMASGSTPRAAIHMYSGTLMFGANATTNSTVVPVSGERFFYKGVFKSGNQKLYKNNVEIASNTTAFTNSSNTLSVYICARNCPSGNNISSMRIYEAKIYEGNTVVRHYIPVRKYSTGSVGLYEIYTDTLLINSGSGSFKVGPTLSTDKALISSSMAVGGRNIIEN